MPPRLNAEIINAAIEGFESQKRKLDAQIAELRSMLDGNQPEPAAMVEAGPRKRKKFSAAARRKMALAQKARWAKIKGESGPAQPAIAPPSVLATLLAERVIITWLQVYYYDSMEVQAVLKNEAPRLAAYRARRQAQAHRAHLSALAALAAVGRMLPVRVRAAVEGPAAARNGYHGNGVAANGDAPRVAVDPVNRIAELLDRARNGAGPAPARPDQELCGVAAEG